MYNYNNDNDNDQKSLKCLHENKEQVNGSEVCIECGLIISKNELITVDTLDDNSQNMLLLLPELLNSQKVHTKEQDWQLNKPIYDLVDGICSKFNLSKVISSQSKAVMERGFDEKLFGRGRAGRKAAVVVIYLVARATSNIPLSLRDVSGAIGEMTNDLSSSLQILKPLTCKVLNIPIDSLRSNHPQDYLEKLAKIGFPNEHFTEDCLELAKRLVEFCKEKSLVEGRKPEAIAMACLLAAYEAKTVFPKKERTSFICNVCRSTGLSYDTVMQRINELKDELIKCGNMNTLLASNATDLLTRDRIFHLMEQILDYCRYSITKPLADPPSFVNSQNITRARIEQLDIAKRRLKCKATFDDQVYSNIDDIIIERLLLHSIPEERIIATTSLKQLLELEEQIDIAINKNGDDDSNAD